MVDEVAATQDDGRWKRMAGSKLNQGWKSGAVAA